MDLLTVVEFAYRDAFQGKPEQIGSLARTLLQKTEALLRAPTMKGLLTTHMATFNIPRCKYRPFSPSSIHFKNPDCKKMNFSLDRYKDGFTEEDFSIVEDPFKRQMIKRVFSMENSSVEEKYKARKDAAIRKF